MTVKTKKEILIAILLVACLLFGTAVMLFVENRVGEPDQDGEVASVRVKITEICASNSSVIANDAGEFPDYIELYNEGNSFNLAGYSLSTDPTGGIDYTFDNIEFQSGEYLIIFLDGTNVPFRLNAGGGEYIALVSKEGTVLDSAATVSCRSNQVMLRTEEGFTLSDEASPGYPNTPEGVTAFREGDKDGVTELAINEILTSNDSILPDFEGDFTDIIEIKNISAYPVSTKGYFISDSLTERNRCPLPDVLLNSGEIMLIFASGKNMTTENGEFHADFKLSVGETAVLSIGSKYIYQDIEACESNYSQSRVITENGIEYIKMLSTAGFDNDEAGAEALEAVRIYTDAPLVINEILLSGDRTPYGGKLRDVIELCNISQAEISTKGWYISDSEDDPYKYAIPEANLAPGECMILYAESGNSDNSTGFGLSSGESVYLTSPDYRRSEYVSCASAGIGCSRSRIEENGEAVYINGSISIGFPNDEAGIKEYLAATRPSEIEISEIVALNKAYIAGPYETYHDFIELHNRTDKDVDLTGWYLSDDTEEPLKGSLDGIIIPAYGYKVIILSTDGINTPIGYPVVNFSVASSGEAICLSKDTEIIDAAVLPSLGQNTSYGRADGEDGFSVLVSPTPEAANSKKALETAIAPTASIPQGVYKETAINVELSGEGNIYYTLDSTVPTAASTLYTGPLKLSSTTVIRCFSVVQGKKTSDITNLTYIINEPDTLETISVVTEPSNLFDTYSGIYATGPYASSEFPYEGANYYNRWEREANVSFFAEDGSGFSENCGVRIFGGLSRALEKKSLAFFFRSSYGSGELNYQLFEDDELSVYESFVLRNTGQDWKLSTMRDAMITTLANDYLDMDVQNCRPVVVYINGEYWGIYFIREKLNEHYVAGHYNIDASKAEVVTANGRTSDSYQALVGYAASNDLSIQANYDYICTLMDVDNYADYIVAEMIIGNADNGNIRFFTYEGGKWRWIMYDVDHGFRSASHNTVEAHLNPAGTGASDMFSTVLINALLKNPDFKKMFLEEMAYQLNNVWTPEIVNAYIDEFSGMIENDIARDCERWNHSYDTWVSSVESLRSFIDSRESYFISHVKSYFGLSDEEMREYGFRI